MKKEIAKIIQKALKEKDVKLSLEEIESKISVPPTQDMGDFAFPCFALAGKLKMSPEDIALELRAKINDKTFSEIQTRGAYINFFMDRKKFALDIIEKVINEKDNFGKINIGEGKKVLIEHTSINPNASPHLGRARNALIGDSLVRIHSFLGFKPEVHYYVNDVSKQIAMLVLADADKLKFEDMLKKYIEISKKVKASKKVEQQVFDILYKFEKGDQEVIQKFQKITQTCVKGQEKILSQLGIHYDFFDYESKYLKDSEKILSEFQKTKKLFQDEEKRMVLDLKGTSVENKMKSPVLVLTRGDGTGLYPLRDISYTIDKLKIAKDNILVLGEDQKLYFEQIREALKLLGYTSPKVVHYSFILLSGKGKTKKMSTRKGDVVLLEDFLKDAITKAKKELTKRKTKGDPEKVGIGAVKYAILKNANNKTINFNLEDALKFEGDTGPYLLYSYARANSILKKVKTKNDSYKVSDLEEKEIELIKKIAEFPQIIKNSYDNLNPSVIANYSYQLAQIFNEFYHACPVIGSETQNFRIFIVESFKQVLKNSLNLLGIEVLDRM